VTKTAIVGGNISIGRRKEYSTVLERRTLHLPAEEVNNTGQKQQWKKKGDVLQPWIGSQTLSEHKSDLLKSNKAVWFHDF